MKKARQTEEAAVGVPVDIVEPFGGRVKAWIKLVRVHQWAKNGLVFVALLTAQKFDAFSLADALGAFLAFSFAASAVYILNDLVDVEAAPGVSGARGVRVLNVAAVQARRLLVAFQKHQDANGSRPA